MARTAIIDFKHLNEFASGDVSKMRRFLYLFKEQSKKDFDSLVKSTTAESWHNAAHSLKSGASAIGAWRLVQATDHAQDEELKLTRENRQFHIDRMRVILGEMDVFIENKMRRES